jgi:hypothetical protein
MVSTELKIFLMWRKGDSQTRQTMKYLLGVVNEPVGVDIVNEYLYLLTKLHMFNHYSG